MDNRIVITTDGDTKLPNQRFNIIGGAIATTVLVVDNIDGATTTFGQIDDDGNFDAFPDGATSGAVLHHGFGCPLGVRVSGITANDVVIDYYYHT